MWVFVFSMCPLAAQEPAPPAKDRDTSPHTVQFVTVDKDVKLETLDWGGTGRALVFLSGMGASAHQFDKFAPKLTGSYHIYGITRRGFGASGVPPLTGANYDADRLGDDVLEACAALKLERPVLVGHSIAGQELSSVGSRHPERVAGLIYLDAANWYAFYDAAHGDLRLDLREVRNQMEELQGPGDHMQLIGELLEKSLPQLERTLKLIHEQQQQVKAAGVDPFAPMQRDPRPVAQAINEGERKYTGFQGVPVLAIQASPREIPPVLKDKPALLSAIDADELARIKAFENAVPGARVVRLAHANHVIYQSNEADVLREMNSFLAGLK
jgi:pimeloyl-ACP methyl ester carboxylesterase